MKHKLFLRRIFASLLLLAVSTLSWAYDFEVGGIFYDITDGNNVAVTNNGKNSYSGTVVIPSSVEYNEQNYTVTSIGEAVFYNCSGLKSITIPESVTDIGDGAFRYCSSLTSVSIGNGVTSIGDFAFGNCSGLSSVIMGNGITSIGTSAFQGCSSLTSVTIPNSVTSIGSSAFWNCSGLSSVIMGNGITSIGTSAFQGCSSLTSVTIPNSVTSIENRAFYGCSGLKSMTIPNSVTNFGQQAFSGCTGTLYINCDIPYYHPSGLTVRALGVFYESRFSEVVIGDAVTSIGNCAFGDCTYLTKAEFASIESLFKISFSGPFSNPLYYAKHLYINGSEVTELVIPNSVTSINSCAFENCSGLTSVTIPESVTTIGNYAFENCSGLKSVTIPNSVTTIGYRAFYGCSDLTSVTIPESVTSIGSWAFDYCSGLTSVTCLAEDVPDMGSNVFGLSPKSTATLYVPATSIEAYKTASQWKEFGKIVGIDPTAVEELKSNKTLKANENASIFDLMGRRLQQKPANGYYIQGGKKYLVK